MLTPPNPFPPCSPLKKKPETNHLRLPNQPLTVATSRSWRGWVAAGSTESVSGKNKKTERGGFEPPKAFDLTRLPIVHLRPLGHLSNSIGNYIRKAVDSSSGAIICVSIAAIAASNASDSAVDGRITGTSRCILVRTVSHSFPCILGCLTGRWPSSRCSPCFL